MSRVALDDVSVTFAPGTPWERVALQHLDLLLEPGDRALVVGGNGAGKSTLADVLSGTIQPTTGTASMDGVPLHRCTDRIAVVIQHTRLQLMSATAHAELAAVSTDRERIPDMLAALGLSHLAHRRIDELSGGQQRRVGLAAALVRGADLLVLDEPMAGLDTESAGLMVDSLGLLDPDAVVVAVTHDLDQTAPLLNQGRRGRILSVHDGRLREEVRA